MPVIVERARARSVVRKYHDVVGETHDEPKVRSASKNSLGPEAPAIPNVYSLVTIPKGRLSGMTLAFDEAKKNAQAAVLIDASRRNIKRRAKPPTLDLTGLREVSTSSGGWSPPTPGLTDSSDEDFKVACTTLHVNDSPSIASRHWGWGANASKGQISSRSKHGSKIPLASKRSPAKPKSSTTSRTGSNAERADVLSDILETDNESRASNRGLDYLLLASHVPTCTPNPTSIPLDDPFINPRSAPLPPLPNNSRWSSSTESFSGPSTPGLASVHRLYTSMKQKHRARRATASTKSAPTTPKTPSSLANSPVQKAFPEETTTSPTLKSRRSYRKLLKPSASAPTSRKPSFTKTETKQKSAGLPSKSMSALPVRKATAVPPQSIVSPSKTLNKSISFLKVCGAGSYRDSTYNAFDNQFSIPPISPRTVSVSPATSPRVSPNFSRPLRSISYTSTTSQRPGQVGIERVNNSEPRPIYNRSNPSAESNESKASAISTTLHALTTSKRNSDQSIDPATTNRSKSVVKPVSSRPAGVNCSNGSGSTISLFPHTGSGGDKSLSSSSSLTALPNSHSSPDLDRPCNTSSSMANSSPTSKSCPSLKPLHPANPILQETVNLDAPVVSPVKISPLPYHSFGPICISGERATGIFTRCGQNCHAAFRAVTDTAHAAVNAADAVITAIAEKAASWHSRNSMTYLCSEKVINLTRVCNEKVIDLSHEMEGERDFKATQYRKSGLTTLVSDPLKERIEEDALARVEREATLAALNGEGPVMTEFGQVIEDESEEDVDAETARERSLRALTGEGGADDGKGKQREVAVNNGGSKAKGKDKALPLDPPVSPPCILGNTPDRTAPKLKTLPMPPSATAKTRHLKHKRSNASSFGTDLSSDGYAPAMPPLPSAASPSCSPLRSSPRSQERRTSPTAHTKTQRNAAGQNVDAHRVYAKLNWEEEMRSMGYDPAQAKGVGLGISMGARGGRVDGVGWGRVKVVVGR